MRHGHHPLVLKDVVPVWLVPYIDTHCGCLVSSIEMGTCPPGPQYLRDIVVHPGEIKFAKSTVTLLGMRGSKSGRGGVLYLCLRA